ncbi:hypothetical protein Fleli_3880 [Bernardetia litoralis DSM 6794]|uniref:Uncharacterized protein n=1 Tax=Bernardetia litoralis (strain ATCC 23117 / DSM 6794 / NBRC 15988 / NCIMB 1366 / Fx l1 / Sio-4) TaxID=880071 RepID=I4AQF0_BERLS|nr:hypothetical protein [Bernardetia litoralis]AFM06185.1 hypothetical protein Fleli_3880 [Bernardetia litoralis DSM 6794]
MKKVILISLFFILAFLPLLNISQAQNSQNKDNIFQTKEDYYEHQIQVEKGLKDWFTYNPLEEDNTTIQLQNILQAYLLAWIMGAPHVNLAIDGKIEGELLSDKRFDYTQNLMLAMMFAKTTYLIENKNAKSTDFETNLAGVKGMLVIYKKIREQTKDKRKYRTDSMEKYLEWEKEGNLEKEVKRIVND